jgi:hypothetical protein
MQRDGSQGAVQKGSVGRCTGLADNQLLVPAGWPDVQSSLQAGRAADPPGTQTWRRKPGLGPSTAPYILISGGQPPISTAIL